LLFSTPHIVCVLNQESKMNTALCLCIVVGVVLSTVEAMKLAPVAAVSGPVPEAVNPLLILSINQKKTTWEAGVNENFKGWKLSEAKKLMGWKPNGNYDKLPKKSYPASKIANLPTNFDSATQWPACTTIATIYDQARCGSCWAFGCVEAVSDRFCIHASTPTPTPLSFEDETCCGPDDGCEGGDAGDAWQYVQDSGLVSAACSPYTVPTCPASQEPCLDFVNTPPCVQQCSDSESWTTSKHFNSNTYGVSGDQTDIMTEIMTNGPVEACFSVYQDFLAYKSGVYQYDGQSQFLGGHCIKIRGWGVDGSGNPYWLCNNSWTTSWGDNGMFKILRGSDECGIEDDVVAGMPTYSK